MRMIMELGRQLLAHQGVVLCYYNNYVQYNSWQIPSKEGNDNEKLISKMELICNKEIMMEEYRAA